MPAKTHGSASQYQTPGYNSQHGSHNFASSGTELTYIVYNVCVESEEKEKHFSKS